MRKRFTILPICLLFFINGSLFGQRQQSGTTNVPDIATKTAFYKYLNKRISNNLDVLSKINQNGFVLIRFNYQQSRIINIKFSDGQPSALINTLSTSLKTLKVKRNTIFKENTVYILPLYYHYNCNYQQKDRLLGDVLNKIPEFHPHNRDSIQQATMDKDEYNNFFDSNHFGIRGVLLPWIDLSCPKE